jgi:two-component system sensor histidine kinase AtoS
LQEALQQLARIEETTTQLLRYARPTDPRHIRLDPNQLIQRAATIVEPRATAAGIRICTQPASPPLLVRADPELMVQVLVNLMLNGIEATTPPGEVHISVASSDSRASIAVRDTGTGIPPSLHQEIFRPFFTTKHQGSGLGLSISRQIVTRHEGTLTVSDHPGGGTTFIVEIPLDNGGVPDG